MEEPNWALEKSLKKVLFRDVVGGVGKPQG